MYLVNGLENCGLPYKVVNCVDLFRKSIIFIIYDYLEEGDSEKSLHSIYMELGSLNAPAILLLDNLDVISSLSSAKEAYYLFYN